MTLEEFAKDAGCVVFEMHSDDAKGWGGKFAYFEKGHERFRTCGFRTPAAAYKSFMADTFGEQATKAIIKLLKKTEKVK